MPSFLYTLIGVAISLPISIALLAWMLHYKKDRKYPKGAFWLLLLAGALCCVPPIIAGLLLDVLGGGIPGILMGHRLAEGEKIPDHIRIANAAISAFFLAALFEEILKFLGLSIVSKRKNTVMDRFDAVLCGAIVGIGFQILEDALYVDPSGSMITTLLRALTPFHFTFGAIMGYFYGEAKATGKKSYYVLAVFVPFLVHGLYDFVEMLKDYNELFFLLFILSMVAMTALTIAMMVKIHKWSKSEKMRAPLNLYGNQ